LNVPGFSGNVSMYNPSEGEAIFPTPIVGMVGLFETLEDITPNSFQNAGDLVSLIGETDASFGGSDIQKLTSGNYAGQAPTSDLGVENDRQAALLRATQ